MKSRTNNKLDSLSKGFRDRLEDYSEPVEKGSWEALEADIALRAKRKVIWRSVYMAAASVALLLGLVLGIWRKAPTEQIAEVVTVAPQVQEADTTDAADTAVTVAAFAANSTPVAFRKSVAVNKSTAAPESTAIQEDAAPEIVQIAPSGANTDETVTTDSAEPAVAAKAAVSERVTEVQNSDFDYWAEEEPVAVKESMGRVSLAVLGGGNVHPGRFAESLPAIYTKSDLLADGAAPQANSSMVSFPNYMSDALLNKADVPVYSLYDFKYNVPISFGVYVRLNLPYKFSLETGLFVTSMAGKVLKNSITEVGRNSMWYMGIPLKVNWSFYSNKYMNSYVSVGGAAEKCISYKYSGERLLPTEKYPLLSEGFGPKDFAMQYSVNAAIGVQWNISPHAALFFEPGISYFFQASNPIETIRNQKPFYVNLVFGIRFTTGK